MSNPTGKVQSIHAGTTDTRAVVAVDVRVACPRCAEGKGCGAGLLSGTDQLRTVEAIVDSRLQLDTGDSVELRLAPSNVLNAAGIVYGLPLAGALLAAGAAYILQLGDAAAALAAIIGLGAGVLAGRRRLSRPECLNQLVPVVEKKLHNAGH